MGRNSILLDIFEFIAHKRLPASRLDPRFKWSKINFVGPSYMLEPTALLKERATSKDSDLVDYIGLASCRRYPDYEAFKDCSLPVELSVLPIERIRNNKLLEIKDNKIHFLLERRNT